MPSGTQSFLYRDMIGPSAFAAQTEKMPCLAYVRLSLYLLHFRRRDGRPCQHRLPPQWI